MANSRKNCNHHKANSQELGGQFKSGIENNQAHAQNFRDNAGKAGD